eukprot:1158927-Pelagomonas_calceolata.AAC.8
MLPGRSSSHIYGRCERGCETMMMWCLHGPVCPVCKGGVCPPRLEIGVTGMTIHLAGRLE